ncbi:DUF2637 domain-containing protein [Streptomyces sp. NPDC052682]|uniref:DUF2637 domain-containing protein n=1 Tax=Streptomyces sp. NPDC052682 TaxID=3154954 RepID=UPI00341E7FD7
MYDYTESGTGRHRAPAAPHRDSRDNRERRGPLVPPDSAWDPAEELAFMLQETMLEESREQRLRRIPPPRDQKPSTDGFAEGWDGPGAGPDRADRPGEDGPGAPPDAADVSAGAPATDSGHLRGLQDITAELPPLKAPSRGHRKARRRRGAIRTVSCVIAAGVTLIASGVSYVGGVASYDPLRHAGESGAQHGIASLWPVLVYGPWLAASLSVLRAALHQRRAVHSWCVVLVFSAIAILLSVAQAPRNAVDMSATALPVLASLACFQQFVRQITLTRPPHRTMPRHRFRPSRARNCTGRE